MTLTQVTKAGLDALALDHVFTIGASGTDHYTFQGEGLNGTVNDPTPVSYTHLTLPTNREV